MSEIQKQQQIISSLSSKGIVNLTPTDLKRLDLAKTKYRQLKNQVADVKAELSDVSVGGLAKGIVARSLGYTAIFASIAGVTQALRAGAEYTLEFESGVKRLETVLDTTNIKAQALEGSLAQLGRTYGEQLGDINKVALELSRAGLALEQVADASEVVIKLALLTGDSIEQSASSIISFVQVFGKDQFGQVIASVDELGAKLAYLANKSRLGTQDINTFANYALASAKATGLTIDAVNGLASAFSNASFNASTIGTQIRKFTIALSKETGAINNFFETIGVNQRNLATRIAQGGQESNQALLEFLDKIKGYNRESYNEALSGVEVLTKNVLQALQNNANEIQTNLRESLQVTSNELDKAQNITEDYRKTWRKFAENSKSLAQNVFDPFIEGATELARTLNDNFTEAKLESYFNVKGFEKIGESSASIFSSVQKTLLEEAKKGDTALISQNKKRLELLRDNLKSAVEVGGREGVQSRVLANLAKQVREVDRFIKDFEWGELTEESAEISIDKKVESLIKAREILIQSRDKVESNSLAYRAFTDEINKNIKAEESLKNSLKSTNNELNNTLKFFSSADLDELNKSIININRSIDIASSKDLDILSSLNTDRLSRLEKEIPQFVSKIQQDLNNNNITIDLGSITTFSGISSKAIELQEKIYKLKQQSEGASKEELVQTKLQVNAYTKAYEQLIRIQEAQTKIENSQGKLLQKRKAQTKEIQKQYKQEDERIRTLVKQLIETNKITVADQERSKAIAEEIATRQENLILIKSTENYEKEIAKIKKLQTELVKVQNKEEEKRVLISERVANKINDEKLRIQELLGLKDKELQSEKALRDLKASKDFQKLSETEQKQQTKILEDLIKQEKAYKGLGKAVIEYSKKVPDLNEALESVANSGLASLESGFMDFFDVTSEGFMNMEKLGKDVLQSIYKELIKTMLVQPLVSGIGNTFSGGSSSSASGATTSLIGSFFGSLFGFNNGGYLPTKGFANGGLLTGGSGKRDDLYMGNVSGTQVFAMGGEFFTKKDSVNQETRPMLEYINKNGTLPKQGATGASTVVSTPVSINIENNTGTPIDAEMVEQMTRKNDNDEYEKVVNIMLSAKESDSRIRSAFANNNQ